MVEGRVLLLFHSMAPLVEPRSFCSATAYGIRHTSYQSIEVAEMQQKRKEENEDGIISSLTIWYHDYDRSNYNSILIEILHINVNVPLTLSRNRNDEENG